MKQTLLNNGNTISYQVTKQLKNSSNYPNYSIDGIYQVPHGKGFRKDLLMVTVYNVGEWGINVIFNIDTFKIERTKTQGKYSKDQTNTMEWDATKIFLDFIKPELIKTLELEAPEELNEKRLNDDKQQFDTLINKLNNEPTFKDNLIKSLEEKTPEQIEQLINNTIKHDKQLQKELASIINELLNPTEPTPPEPTNKTTQDTTNKDTTNQTYYIAANRSFSTYTEAEKYCNESDFPTDIIKEASEPLIESIQSNEPELFYLYKNTFKTYAEAFNHACKYQIYTHMIISSHSFLTNEKLQQLEYDFTFKKSDMNYKDMILFEKHLLSIPESLDQQNRLYKLKSMIQRYENKQRNIQQKKELQNYHMEQIGIMLNDMYSKGVIKKEMGSIVDYYYKGEKIYGWLSGISTEKMYNELLEVYNHYFNKELTTV